MSKIIICNKCKGRGFNYKQASIEKEVCRCCEGSGRLIEKIVYEPYKEENEIETCPCLMGVEIKIGKKYRINAKGSMLECENMECQVVGIDKSKKGVILVVCSDDMWGHTAVNIKDIYKFEAL